MVVVQVALTVVLLVCAGLLMRTVMRLVTEDSGFDTRNGLAMRLMLTQTIRFEAAELAPFVNRLVTEVRAMPGVVAAGIGSAVPPNPVSISMTYPHRQRAARRHVQPRLRGCHAGISGGARRAGGERATVRGAGPGLPRRPSR